MRKKHPYYGKSMIIDFPEFSHTMGFVAFSRTVGNLWETHAFPIQRHRLIFSCDDAVPCLISCLAFLFGYSLSHYFHSAASSIIVLKGVSK